MKIAFTIRGQMVSMKNSRDIVMFGKRPGVKKSDKALAYEKAALLQIPAEAKQMLTGPLIVTMRIYYASERPDLDGALLLDIMAAKYGKSKGKLQKIAPGQWAYGEGARRLERRGVYENDRQCRELHFYHFIDVANPRTEVEIETVLPQQVSLISDEHERPAPKSAELEPNPF